MKYLFYDCEFASSKGGKNVICEFGYVCTDENMKILEKENLVINPNLSGNEWDYYALKHILQRTKATYEQSPEFSYYYEKIKSLLLEADYIFGHAISNDVRSVDYAIQRYGSPCVDYTFYNIDKFFNRFSGNENKCNLEVMLEMLGKEKVDGLHDAENDAYMTMLVYFGILEKLQISTEEIIKLCPDARGKIENSKMLSTGNGTKKLSVKNGNNLSADNTNGKYFLYFIDNAKPTANGDKLKDKKISIGLIYEKHHFRQMIKLVQLIVNEGGSYISLASQGDIFVKCDCYNGDGKLKDDCRLNHVNEAKKNGAKIEIIDFSAFLKLLGITEKDLDEAPYPEKEVKQFISKRRKAK